MEHLHVFGSAARESTLADVWDLYFLVQFKPMAPVQYARNYFSLIEKLEEFFHSPIDLVETEVIDNPYFKEALEESRVPLYGAPQSESTAL